MKPHGKRQLEVWIREETKEEWDEFVDKKYQYYHHEMYYYEVEEALLFYMEYHIKKAKERTHTHTKENTTTVVQQSQSDNNKKPIPLGSVPPPPPPVKRGQTAAELRDQIIDCLITHGVLAGRPATLNTGHLKQAIACLLTSYS
jgi:hypothetical protein